MSCDQAREFYVNIGKDSGPCGHRHRTLYAATRCVKRLRAENPEDDRQVFMVDRATGRRVNVGDFIAHSLSIYRR